MITPPWGLFLTQDDTFKVLRSLLALKSEGHNIAERPRVSGCLLCYFEWECRVGVANINIHGPPYYHKGNFMP